MGSTLLLSYLAYQTLINKPIPSRFNFPAATFKPATSSSKPRSIASGVVTQVVVAKSIDLKTRTAINPNNIFSSTDPTIYLVMTVKNPPPGTKIEYVRYLNDRF